MTKEIKAVIFDQDGLMFDTERISAKVWAKVGPLFGITIKEDFLSRVRGSSVESARPHYMEAFGPDLDYDGLRKTKVEFFHEEIRLHGLPVKKGLKELLIYLKNHSYKVAMATSSDREWSLQNLVSTGVIQYFDEYVCGDMVSRCKPDPELFLTAAKKLGQLPEHCLVLEDSLNGIEAALRGGFEVVMVPDLTWPDEELEKKLLANCCSLLEVIPLLEERKRMI